MRIPALQMFVNLIVRTLFSEKENTSDNNSIASSSVRSKCSLSSVRVPGARFNQGNKDVSDSDIVDRPIIDVI
jgi:hypothetical protein